MGSKSSNTIKTKEMLPLFRVISELEKPVTSPSSIRSTSCYQIDESVGLTNDGDKSIDVSLSDFSLYRQNSNISSVNDLNVLDCVECKVIRGSEKKTRSKKRRRLKHIRNASQHIYPKVIDRKSHRYDIDRRKTGMFTTMAVNMYQEDAVDISRHFKNYTDEKKSDPIYEDPEEIIVHNKKSNSKKKKKKSGRKNVKANDDDSVQHNIDDHSTKFKISKKVIIKRYESMLSALLEKCKHKDILMKENNDYIFKMKNKIKEILDYNNQFADENEYLIRQHDDMKICIERLKSYITSLEGSGEPKAHITTMAANQSSCHRCNILESSAIKIESDNVKLNEDVIMLKNVVFRLNVQLSRYQDKLRNASQTIKKYKTKDNEESKESISIPSLPLFSPSNKSMDNLNIDTKPETDPINVPKLTKNNSIHDDSLQPDNDTFVIEYSGSTTWGDVNTHTLAPLLNAYQESIMEKDDLVRDYEKEFNRFTSKLKTTVHENNNLHNNLSKITAELIALKETCGLAVKERDDLRKENSILKDKVNGFEKNIKDVHECYEQKMESLSRDYTIIHQEYFKTKTGLAAAQGRCQVLEDHQKSLHAENMMPSKVHTMRIDECKRLFEELKNRHGLETSKLSTRLNMLEECNVALEKKYILASNEKHNIETKYKHTEKILKKCRHTLVSYRKELTALKTSRDIFKRRASRATNLCRQLAVTLEHAAGDERFQHLKQETLNVQKEALKELDILEARMKEQDVTLNKIKEDNMSEVTKLEDVIREKEATIEAMGRHLRKERLPRFTTQDVDSATSEALMSKRGLGVESLLKRAQYKFSSAPNKSAQREYISPNDTD